MQKVLFTALVMFSGAIIFLSGCSDNSVTPGGVNIPVISTYPVSGSCVSSFVRNINGSDYAFVALGSAGLQILNVTNPGSIQNSGSFSATGYTDEVYAAVIDSVPYAFVCAGSGGLVVLNVSNPASPVVDTIINYAGDEIYSVFVDSASQKLYTGGKNAKLYVMNLSSLPAVTSVATYTSATNINEIQIQDNVAYIAEDGGLDIVNVTNPANPVRYSLGSSDDYAYDVRVNGVYAYISNNNNGVLVLNVSNPSSPQQTGYLQTTDIALASTINGNIVYVAEDASGVEAFDVSNPSAPSYIASYITNSYSEHVYFYNGYTFVSDYNKYVVLRYP